MIQLYFLFGFTLYCIGAQLNVMPSVKAFAWYPYLGASLGFIANFLWYKVAQNTSENSEVVVYGFYWDTMVILALVAIPMLFHGVRFNFMSSCGLILITLGIILTKLSSTL